VVALALRTIGAARATTILRRLFGHIESGVAFRLWDGTSVQVGAGAPVCTVVLHRQETFIRLVRDPSPLNFAEAYVEGAIDIEGDLFAAMKLANSIEDLRVSAVDRLRLLAALVRG
jgi:cyclopropane-fatty-acyl-phospholipid synthase